MRDDPDLLRGRLDSETDEIVYPEGYDAVSTPEIKRCEHGIPVDDDFDCPECSWLYGWESRGLQES